MNQDAVPQTGGSYVRDPLTGELARVQDGASPGSLDERADDQSNGE